MGKAYKPKSSKTVLVCILMQILQGVVTSCYEYFLAVKYSTDAPEGFYTIKYIVYVSISVSLLGIWGYLLLKMPARNAMLLSAMPCLAWLIGIGLYPILRTMELGLAYSIFHLIVTSIKAFSACPLACIHVFVKDFATAAKLSPLVYAVFFVICFVVNRKRARSANKAVGTRT